MSKVDSSLVDKFYEDVATTGVNTRIMIHQPDQSEATMGVRTARTVSAMVQGQSEATLEVKTAGTVTVQKSETSEEDQLEEESEDVHDFYQSFTEN